MHLPRFDYERPASAAEAGRLLGRYGCDARLVAGGTDLYPRLKYGLLCPRMIVHLKGLPLQPPAVDDEGVLHLDAMTTFARPYIIGCITLQISDLPTPPLSG